MELLVATRNQGKLREIRRLLAGHGVTVLGLEDFPDLPEVIEDGDTFRANAYKKATEIARLTGRPTLADDSGLEVEALQGRPGVYSARFAGPSADDAANNARLLAELAEIPEGRRQAAFHCAMALANPDGGVFEVDGRIEGLILQQPSGSGGFGYDPLFWVPPFKMTMAELPLDVKNGISHRGQALGRMLPKLLALDA